MFKRFLTDESGATAIEYGLIAGLIFLAIVTAVHYYIENTEAIYKSIGYAVVGATSHDG
jgi:pilus assembly protein Flp/PilA